MDEEEKKRQEWGSEYFCNITSLLLIHFADQVGKVAGRLLRESLRLFHNWIKRVQSAKKFIPLMKSELAEVVQAEEVTHFPHGYASRVAGLTREVRKNIDFWNGC